MATFEELYEEIEAEVRALILEARVLVKDGLTWSEMWALTKSVVEAATAICEKLDAAGEQKKELVLFIVDKFYDEVVKPIDMPWVPNWMEPAVDRLIGEAIHMFAEQLIDLVVSRSNRLGWLEK